MTYRRCSDEEGRERREEREEDIASRLVVCMEGCDMVQESRGKEEKEKQEAEEGGVYCDSGPKNEAVAVLPDAAAGAAGEGEGAV